VVYLSVPSGHSASFVGPTCTSSGSGPTIYTCTSGTGMVTFN
jgi:hypothetical protein